LTRYYFLIFHEKKGYGFPLSPLKTMKDIGVFSAPGNALGVLGKRKSHDSDSVKTTDGGSER
jgi:hypothetical protein